MASVTIKSVRPTKIICEVPLTFNGEIKVNIAFNRTTNKLEKEKLRDHPNYPNIPDFWGDYSIILTGDPTLENCKNFRLEYHARIEFNYDDPAVTPETINDAIAADVFALLRAGVLMVCSASELPPILLPTVIK